LSRVQQTFETAHGLGGDIAQECDLGIGLAVPHAVARVTRPDGPDGGPRDSAPDFAAAARAVDRLLRDRSPVPAPPMDLLWRRDPLGKPVVEWTGATAAWARETGLDNGCLHVSNTHDAGEHVVIAAYGAELAGIGIDLVWLPRLCAPGKDETYLRRFARRFMSDEEYAEFEATAHPPPGAAAPHRVDIGDGVSLLSAYRARDHAPGLFTPSPHHPLASLRLRTAAHFSLMEAASKACGTGLKIGVGMGRDTSLPKQALGALCIAPTVRLLFGPEALARLVTIGATHYEAFVRCDADRLFSLVALYKSSVPGATPVEKEAGGTGPRTESGR